MMRRTLDPVAWRDRGAARRGRPAAWLGAPAAWRAFVVAGALALLSIPAAAPLCAQTTTVIIVRHAEKVDDSEDAALSEAGRRRAASLAAALMHADVDAVYVTQWSRTRDTASPAAQQRGIEPVVLATGGGTAAHAAAIAARIREREHGRTVLVVGHSNTVPAIISALGGPDIGEIEDDEYDNFLVLLISEAGSRLLRSRF
jgi:phosphohistidine phosphatase SixA